MLTRQFVLMHIWMLPDDHIGFAVYVNPNPRDYPGWSNYATMFDDDSGFDDCYTITGTNVTAYVWLRASFGDIDIRAIAPKLLHAWLCENMPEYARGNAPAERITRASKYTHVFSRLD